MTVPSSLTSAAEALAAPLWAAAALMVPLAATLMWYDLTARPPLMAWVMIESGSTGVGVAATEALGAPLAALLGPLDPLGVGVNEPLPPHALAMTTTSPANTATAGLDRRIKV
jgi:hypothetical protein